MQTGLDTDYIKIIVKKELETLNEAHVKLVEAHNKLAKRLSKLENKLAKIRENDVK